MRSPFLSVFSQISSIVFLVLKLFRFIWRVFYWNNTRTRAEQNQQQIQSISIPGRRNWQQEEIDADMDFWYTPAFAPFCVGFFFFVFGSDADSAAGSFICLHFVCGIFYAFA